MESSKNKYIEMLENYGIRDIGRVILGYVFNCYFALLGNNSRNLFFDISFSFSYLLIFSL